jgi:hypothetical protein
MVSSKTLSYVEFQAIILKSEKWIVSLM